jgi:predicted nucleotidyltransferase
VSEHSLREIPDGVRRVVTLYLQRVDESLRDRIEGLYLVGSLALDDYQAEQSDIDFVAVTADRLTAEEMDRLEAVHQALLPEVGRPWFDGIYVTWSDLEHNPKMLEAFPHPTKGDSNDRAASRPIPLPGSPYATIPFPCADLFRRCGMTAAFSSVGIWITSIPTGPAWQRNSRQERPGCPRRPYHG